MDTRWIQRQTRTDCGCQSRVRSCQKDLTGLRIGELTVLEPTDHRSNGSTVWRCRCSCGETISVSAARLSSGTIRFCRKCRKTKTASTDLTGQKFGRLTVESFVKKEKGINQWKCRCECGNTVIVKQNCLLSGKTRSCGCLKKETAKKNLQLFDGTSAMILEKTRNKLGSNNTSGHKGVYQNKKTGKWIAQITFKRKTYYLGSYQDIHQAIQARKKGEEELYENFLKRYYTQK